MPGATNGLDESEVEEMRVEVSDAVKLMATAWQKLTHALETGKADIVERAGKEAFGEEAFGDAMSEAVQNA